MGKHSPYTRYQATPRKKEIHPIWRGVGFLLIVLTPIMAYAGALVLLDENVKQGWVRIPAELIASGTDPLLYAKIILTVVLVFLLYIVFSLVTFVLYRLFAPPRYGPYDVPPVHYRGRRYRR
jgi:hypothetical protein